MLKTISLQVRIDKAVLHVSKTVQQFWDERSSPSWCKWRRSLTHNFRNVFLGSRLVMAEFTGTLGPCAKQVNWSTWRKIMYHLDNRRWEETCHMAQCFYQWLLLFVRENETWSSGYLRKFLCMFRARHGWMRSRWKTTLNMYGNNTWRQPNSLAYLTAIH